PARGPASSWCWPPRPAPCSTASTTSRSRTSASSPGRSSATGSSPTSTPRPRASSPTTSSRGWSRRCPSTNTRPSKVENYLRYLNPQTLASLEGLDLQARMVVDGYVAGMHPSPYQGFSVEFAEHREYVPGDDIRHVDWKVWSKTDKLYLKQYEEETNLLLYLLLDTSESMAYASGQNVSKLDYA